MNSENPIDINRLIETKLSEERKILELINDNEFDQKVRAVFNNSAQFNPIGRLSSQDINSPSDEEALTDFAAELYDKIYDNLSSGAHNGFDIEKSTLVLLRSLLIGAESKYHYLVLASANENKNKVELMTFILRLKVVKTVYEALLSPHLLLSIGLLGSDDKQANLLAEELKEDFGLPEYLQDLRLVPSYSKQLVAGDNGNFSLDAKIEYDL